MKVIIGLGNPGAEYAGTRHNTGFMAVSKLAKDRGATFAEKTKFKSYVAEAVIEGEKVLLVKPTTFYNNVGESVRALIDFYKLNPSKDLLVIHDDLALSFGLIRVRRKGSDAGNNGIKSINAHIGHEYTRIRVGIEVAPRSSSDSSFVLSRFSEAEMGLLRKEIDPKIRECIAEFLEGTIEDTSYSFLPDTSS